MQPRSDYKRVAKSARDPRQIEQIIQHYMLERDLSDRLRNASASERKGVYKEVYGILFGSLPHHPQNNKNFVDHGYISRQAEVLRKLVEPGRDFVEIGAGDARLAVAMAPHCRSVTAIDVTDSLFDQERAPGNVRFLLSEGTDVALASDSVDLVYSNQLMEHLHPDDAEEQLREIIRVLRPGGRYFCITPNVTSGPHDVSKYFDRSATCFHLKEYSFDALASMMREVGFRTAVPLLVRRGGYRALPLPVARSFETLFKVAQAATGLSLRSDPRVRNALGINMLATK